MMLLGPSHLIAARRELKDRIDLNRDRLLLGDLERVMGEIVGVVVLVEKPVRGAARMRQQRVERLMLYLRIAGDRAGVADEGRDLVAFHSRGHVRQGHRREGLRDRQRVSQLVDFNDVGDVPAAIADPDDTARENQTQEEETASGDLPVALSENEVSVSFVPFATRFEIWVALHANASPCKSGIHTSKCGSL